MVAALCFTNTLTKVKCVSEVCKANDQKKTKKTVCYKFSIPIKVHDGLHNSKITFGQFVFSSN